MTISTRSLAFAPALLLAACVTVPSGPTVMALPGTGKSFEAFQADNLACQQYAQATIGAGNPQQAANNAAAANAVVGSLIGAAAGAAIGAATGQAGHGAAIGAGSGLILGTAASGPAYGYSYSQAQGMYDNAYVQCMYAKGNQVPVRAGFRDAPPSRPAPAPYYGPPAPYYGPPAS